MRRRRAWARESGAGIASLFAFATCLASVACSSGGGTGIDAGAQAGRSGSGGTGGRRNTGGAGGAGPSGLAGASGGAGPSGLAGASGGAGVAGAAGTNAATGGSGGTGGAAGASSATGGTGVGGTAGASGVAGAGGTLPSTSCAQPSPNAVWTAVTPASARGPLDIASVSVDAANDGWLIGEGLISTGPSTAAFIDQVQRWNAATWATSFDGFPSTQLQSLFALGGGDVWAVGTGMTHWNGTTWTDLSPSGAATLLLTSVWGLQGSDVWSGGDGHLFHWTGASWTEATVVPALDNGFDVGGFWGAASTDVWAGGGYPASHDFLGILHWDGTSWTQVMSSITGYITGESARINGIWGSGANDIWGVGGADAGSPIWHYDGTAWTQAVVPALNGTTLAGILGFCASDVWIVGSGSAGVAAVFHYDGQTWSPVDVGATVPLLFTISGVSTNDLWIGGQQGTLLHRHL